MQNPMAVEHVGCWLCGSAARLDPVYGRVSFYRCSSCGFLFAPERSSAELQALYTDEYFEQYPGGESYVADEGQRRHEARLRLRWVRDHVTTGRLMEVGAANGIFLHEAQGSGFETFGIEPAEGLAARAREKFGVEVVAGFVEEVSIPPEPFKVICAWHVIEHIRRPQGALRRLRGSIQAGGWLFLEIPNIESVKARRKGTDWFHLDPENHVGFYTRDQLAEVLRQSGFELESTHTVTGLSYLRRRLAVRPVSLAVRAYDTVTSRSRQSRPHEHVHEMLRAVARPV